MMPPLSSREIEMLSTYLDGHLSVDEGIAMQRSMAQRADLREGLEGLRQTRAMLRHAPRRKVPRNFMLKPEMVPAKRRVFGRPVLSLGLASVLATIFLLLSVMLEFVPLPTFGTGAPMAPVVQDAGSGRNLASTAPQPTRVAEMSQPASTAAPTAAPAALPTGVQKAVEATHPAVKPLSTPTAPDLMRSTGDILPQATLPAPQPTQAVPVLQPTATSADTEYKLGAQPTPESSAPGGTDSAPMEARKTLTWLQTLLVVLAASTALAALYLRRKH